MLYWFQIPKALSEFDFHDKGLFKYLFVNFDDILFPRVDKFQVSSQKKREGAKQARQKHIDYGLDAECIHTNFRATNYLEFPL